MDHRYKQLSSSVVLRSRSFMSAGELSGARARHPALDQIMQDASRRRFDMVLVWSCDRLARSVAHFLHVLP